MHFGGKELLFSIMIVIIVFGGYSANWVNKNGLNPKKPDLVYRKKVLRCIGITCFLLISIIIFAYIKF